MFTLYHMQQEGILVRGDELRRFGQSLSGRIDELEKAIWEQAGQQFNINSPKQLGTVLFEDMKLPGGRRRRQDIRRPRMSWRTWRRMCRSPV